MDEVKGFAERKALAIIEAWERAKVPSDPKWSTLYVEAAIEAGWPCFETVTLEDETIAQVNAGPHGWRRWLMSARGEGR